MHTSKKRKLLHALVFLNGDLTTLPGSIQKDAKNALVICADGAVSHAFSAGILPDVVIGDFDSIDEDSKKKVEALHIPCITYPKEKDSTDSELAIEYALQKKVNSISVYGLLGGRVDHMFVNVLLLSKYAKKTEIVIFEKDMELRFIRKKGLISAKKGDELSLISLTSQSNGITTKNLKYPLRNETLKLGSTRGLSNVLVKDRGEVVVKKGTILAVLRKLH